MSEVKVGDTAMGAVNVVRYNWKMIAAFGMIPLILMVAANFLQPLIGPLGVLVRIAAMVMFVPFAVNMHRFTRAVADGAAPEQPPLFQWTKVEWIYLALMVGMYIGAAIIIGLVFWMLALVFGPIGGGLVALIVALAVCYLLTRLSFVFPQDALENNVDLARSWNDTAPGHISIFFAYAIVLLMFIVPNAVVMGIGGLFGNFGLAIFGILAGIIGFYGAAAFVAATTLAHKTATT